MKKQKTQTILSKKLEPPFKPNLMETNFDVTEVSKGEKEFRGDLQESLNGEGRYHALFEEFYYCDESLVGRQEEAGKKKGRRTESVQEQYRSVKESGEKGMSEVQVKALNQSLLNRACSAKQMVKKSEKGGVEQFQSQSVLKNIQRLNQQTSQINQSMSKKASAAVQVQQKTPSKNAKRQDVRAKGVIKSQEKKRVEKTQHMRHSQGVEEVSAGCAIS